LAGVRLLTRCTTPRMDRRGQPLEGIAAHVIVFAVR
jgi:hypothetical protein